MVSTLTFMKKRLYALWIVVFLSLFMGCEPSAIPDTAGDDPVRGNGITVLFPNRGTTFHVGDTMIISWDLQMSPDSIAGLQIDLSPNNGRNYFAIGIFIPTDPQFLQKKYEWIIPDTINNGLLYWSTRSDSCSIFIHDYFIYTIGDVSDGFFSIH
jgi:hypothetical protein